MFDVTLIFTDKYSLQEIKDDLLDEYITDENDEISVTNNRLDSLKNVYVLINLLFSNPINLIELYNYKGLLILDLSAARSGLITFKGLEDIYEKWLEETGRKTSMNEFGMLVDFRGHTEIHINKKYFLMRISPK